MILVEVGGGRQSCTQRTTVVGWEQRFWSKNEEVVEGHVQTKGTHAEQMTWVHQPCRKQSPQTNKGGSFLLADFIVLYRLLERKTVMVLLNLHAPVSTFQA